MRAYDRLAHGHGRGPKDGCLPSGAGWLPIPERPPGDRTSVSPAGASPGDPSGHAEVQFVPILPELPYRWPGETFFSIYIFRDRSDNVLLFRIYREVKFGTGGRTRAFAVPTGNVIRGCRSGAHTRRCMDVSTTESVRTQAAGPRMAAPAETTRLTGNEVRIATQRGTNERTERVRVRERVLSLVVVCDE